MPDNDERALQKRLLELSARAGARGRAAYSEFLTPAEQDMLARMELPSPARLFGGFELAERKIAIFGDEDEAPIICLRIAPAAQKFADELTHRDLLGALMSLGVRREVLGDIIVSDNCGYLFCLSSIADYIREQLTKVKHTTVAVSVCDSPPEGVGGLPERMSVSVSSERLDALVAAIYNLSRAESKQLFAQGKVFMGWRPAEGPDVSAAFGATISVRGYGRFIYEGVDGCTRRGRMRVLVRIF